MASKPPTLKAFQKTGFYKSTGIPALQEQLARFSRPDSEIRQQAESQYAPAYNVQKTVFQNQLSELATSRDRDVQKLNAQYDKSLNGVMAGLNKQNMGRSSLVATRGVEVENARNGAISDASYSYLQKENDINSQIQQADATYAVNVENKAAELSRQNQAQYIELLAQIAQLQQSGYSAYASYLLNK